MNVKLTVEFDKPWVGLPLPTLKIILRLAKDPKRGLRPFFINPHDMIALREHVAKLERRSL